ALAFGAQGIGLCRTEHMFFKPEERIPIVRAMIQARDRESRQRALDRLLPMQREDFQAIFRTMAGRPVTIRLLDPPLHEFLPRESRLLEEQGDLREKRTGLEHVDQALRTEYALDSGFQRILPRAALETELARVRTRMDELKGDLDSVRSLQEANPMLGN